MNEKILIVEDEPGLRLTLTDRLRGEGYAVETAADGPTGLERALAGGHDLILLDVMLPGLPPGKNGFDICRELRERSVRTPILMLTAMGQTADKVRGLKIGADDYLTKPFETSELLARIEALLRRRFSAAPREAPVRVGRVLVDLKKTEVSSEGEALPLSAKEFTC